MSERPLGVWTYKLEAVLAVGEATGLLTVKQRRVDFFVPTTP